MSDLNSNALEYLRENLGKATAFAEAGEGGADLYSRPVFNAPHPADVPLPDVLRLRTLKSLVGYFRSPVDGLGVADNLFQVRSPTEVAIVGRRIGWAEHQRPVMAVAECEPVAEEAINTWLKIETLIMALQVHFRDCGILDEQAHGRLAGDPACDRDKLIKALSEVKAEDFQITADDGLNQVYTSKRGSVTSGWDSSDNPAMLSPFSSFPEIELPPAAFFVRLKGSKDEAPMVALRPADGGAWKLQAVELIGKHLVELLGTDNAPTVIW